MQAVSTRGWSHGRLDDVDGGPHIETHRIRDADVSELLSIVKDRQTLIECIVGKPFMTKDKVLCSTISFSK